MPCMPAARLGDQTMHGGVIVQGSPNVTIGNKPAARLLHYHTCPIPGHVGGPITKSSPTVLINGFGAARVLDACTCGSPPSGGGGGGGDKEKQGKFKLKAGVDSGEKKWGEKEGEGKNLKEAWKDLKDKPTEAFKPKLAAKVGQEWKKDGEVKKWGSEDNNASLLTGEAKASWGAGVESDGIKNLKAKAGGKVEAEGSVAAAKGKLGDAKTGIGEVGGEAKFLTAKGEAGAEGKFEVKDGKVEAAYVEGVAGVGGSVVEGKVEGKTKAFKIPFTNLGISLGGEVSGALLTAEAKAEAHAGYKDKKWSFGFGAKIGAALAGLGFKFNVTIEKLDPPKPPPKPPGVTGAAGIDPIAVGCFTVLVGDFPKPYVPGPPKKTAIPFVDVGAPKNRNKEGPKTPPPPGNPPVRQLTSDLDELYVHAAAAQKELSILVRTLAATMNGKAVIPEKLKGRERAEEKIKAEYGGDAGLIMDLARASLEFEKMSDLKKALAAIEASVEIVRKKDRFEKPLPSGYRDVLLNVKTSNGHVCELQLHLKQILEVKNGPGHALYEEIRAIEAVAKNADKPMDAKQALRIADLTMKSKKLYDTAFAKAQ